LIFVLVLVSRDTELGSK